VDQIVDLVTHGVDGVHLYTMNNPYIARKIYKATHSLFESTQKGNPGGSSASA
jgi:methylenetetrahydrofolate reductase (NAD(P)H)